MRSKLLETVALSAVIGFTSLAAAQSVDAQEQSAPAQSGAAHPEGAQPELKPPVGGGTGTQQGPRSAQTESKPGATGQQPIPEKIEPGAGGPAGQHAQQAQGQNAATPDRGAKSSEPERNAQQRTPEGAASRVEPERGTPRAESQNANPKSQQRAAENKESGGNSAELSTDQRTKIKGIIDRGHPARLDHPDFSVRVGTVVPRSVHVTVLPAEIVEIVPQYRGYDYVMVGDEILIIDPHSLEIVAIIEA